MLYLAESDYGDAVKRGKPTISIGAWLQYVLDNFPTVKDAVEAMRADPFTLILANAPNGFPATIHLSISDPTGDSAILQYVDGKLEIYHDPKYTIMTKSPTYDQQLAINTYWELVGGHKMMPGTFSAADRYVRASYSLKASRKFKDPRASIAAVFSQMRTIGVPLGMTDPELPNISSTLWRTVFDHDTKRLYFDSVINPSVLWVDLDSINFASSTKPMKLNLNTPRDVGGDVSSEFNPAEPFKFLTP